MITLLYSGNNSKLIKAVKNANAILATDAFYTKIAELPEYEPELSGEIAKKLKKANHEIIIESYRNPFGKKTTKAVSPFLFKVNTSKLSAVVAFAVHSLVRQSILSLSFENQKKHFERHHPEGQNKNECLSVRIGEIAEAISRKTRHFA